MAISKVVVVDGNNLIVRIDRGVAGRGVTDVEPVVIDGSLYLVFTFSDGTTETVGPVGTIQYVGQAPIVVAGSTISLTTVPVNLGGTGATTASGARTNLGLGTIATQNASSVAITGGTITGITDLAVADGGTGSSTAAGAMVNLLPSYTGNANKRLGLDGTATGLEWVTDGGGTVTSVNVSGGTTGMSFSGGPVTTSGTITLSGTLDLDNGGTGATTAAGARTNLNAVDQALTLTAGTGLSGGGDLTANRSFSITNTGVTAAAYGAASKTLTATVNAQGQLTVLADTPIAIANTQISGLGTMSTQNANAVAITGGSITGITDLAVADGGTGASDASGARTNLGAAASATTISAGTGLSGGGDLSANRTLSIANTAVTAGAYGSASNTLTATVNAQGQLTALAATPIAIANTQVSGLGTMSTQNSNAVTITGGSITGITDLAIADGGTGASNAADARSNLGLGSAAVLNAGVALGVATLDAGGTVPLSQIPASIQGGVSYQGAWNASTNTPTLVSSVGSKGYYYVVSVAGNTNLNGVTDWLVGDWAIFNGSVWQKIDNTDQVASVNGYTGVVVLSNTDVGAPPTSLTISAGTGLTGGGSLAANRTLSIANTTVTAAPYGTASAVPTFTVNGQGQLTAASDVTIAIANTQVSGLGTMSTQNANSVAITGGSINGTTIGATTATTGAFTTLGGTTITASTKVATPFVDAVSSAGGALRNASGTSVIQWGVGGSTNSSVDGSINLNGTNAQIDISPTGTGHVHINPTGIGSVEINPTSAGTINNMAIGGTTPRAGAFTTLTASTAIGVASGGTGVTTSTGTGSVVLSTSPTLVTPLLGTPTSVTLTNATGLPLTTGVTGTLPIANGGTGLTTTPANGALDIGNGTGFTRTTLTAGTGVTITNGSGAITINATGTGGTVTSVAASVPSFLSIAGSPITTSGTLAISLSGTALPTTSGGTGLTSFTANGVAYASSSSALATGSALTFDGTNLDLGTVGAKLNFATTGSATRNYIGLSADGYSLEMVTQRGAIQPLSYKQDFGAGHIWNITGSEIFRATSSSLYTASGINVGIGLSNPLNLLHIASANSNKVEFLRLQSTSGFDVGGGSFIRAGSSGGNSVLFGFDYDSQSFQVQNGSTNAALITVGTGGTVTINSGGLNLGAGGVNGYISGGTWYGINAGNWNFQAGNGSQNFVWKNSSASSLMTLSNSGNLSLASAPSAFGATYKAFQPNGYAAYVGDGYYGRAEILNNAYASNINIFNYYDSNAASRYSMQLGAHLWYSAPSGTTGGVISWTQAMTLTTASNLLIGTTLNNYSASIIASNEITTNWASTIGLRYNVSGQTNNYYKGMTGTSITDGQARGLHIFNYDGDSNVGINFYPNSYAGQTANPAMTIANTNYVGFNRINPAYTIDAYDVSSGVTTMRLLNTYGLVTSNAYGYSRFQGLSGGNGLFISQNVNGINGGSSVLDNSNTAGYAISMGENYSGWAFLKYAAVAGTVTPSVSMFLTSAGNLLVGTTSTSGSVGNYANIVGGVFRSFSGSVVAATNTYVTLFGASGGTIASYLVSVWVSADDVVNYQANVIVNTQGGTSTKVTTIVGGNLLAFQMSGYNLQAAQLSGGTATISYSAIRIAG